MGVPYAELLTHQLQRGPANGKKHMSGFRVLTYRRIATAIGYNMLKTVAINSFPVYTLRDNKRIMYFRDIALNWMGMSMTFAVIGAQYTYSRIKEC